MRRVAVLSLLLIAACGPGRSPVTVDRMDVTLTALLDGSLRVEERLAARFDGDSGSTFRRAAPVWHHDGVADVVATLDGKICEPGTGAGQVVIGAGPALDVRWTVAAAPGSSHVFGLTYRAANAFDLSGIRATMSWLVLPPGRDFDVANAAVTVNLPDGVVLLSDPWVEEAGWKVVRLPHGMTAARASVPRAESGTVGMEFSADQLTAPTPQWQSTRDLLEQLIPAFIAGGLFILVVAAGVLWMVRLKFPAWPATGGPAAEIDLRDVTEPMRVAIMRGRLGAGRAALADLIAAGFADPERVRAARDLRRAGLAVAIFGLATWVAVAVTMRQFGAWPLAVPWSIVISGVMFLAGGARLDVLSAAGAAARVLYFARVLDGRTTA